MLLPISLADLAAVATAAAVFVGACALLLQRYQARTAFEDAVVRQYREIIRPGLLANAILLNLLAGVPEHRRERLQQVYLYLDLCNEQVFLRSIGRISRSTWRIQWSDGIRGYVEGNPAIASDWHLIKSKTNDFRELRCFEARGWSDPRHWEPRWRWPLIRLGAATPRVPESS